MSSLNFTRSPLLAKMPHQEGLAPGVIRLRWIVFGLGLLLGTVIGGAILSDLIGFAPLLILYDNIFLQIKGNTFTGLLPISAGVWSFIGLITLIGLSNWLSGGSPLKTLHYQIWMTLIRNYTLHTSVLNFFKLLSWFFKPNFARLIAFSEWEQMRHELWLEGMKIKRLKTLKEEDAFYKRLSTQYPNFLKLLHFSVGLETFFNKQQADYPALLLRWHYSLLLYSRLGGQEKLGVNLLHKDGLLSQLFEEIHSKLGKSQPGAARTVLTFADLRQLCEQLIILSKANLSRSSISGAAIQALHTSLEMLDRQSQSIETMLEYAQDMLLLSYEKEQDTRSRHRSDVFRQEMREKALRENLQKIPPMAAGAAEAQLVFQIQLHLALLMPQYHHNLSYYIDLQDNLILLLDSLENPELLPWKKYMSHSRQSETSIGMAYPLELYQIVAEYESAQLEQYRHEGSLQKLIPNIHVEQLIHDEELINYEKLLRQADQLP